jgi:hypothetical protein
MEKESQARDAINMGSWVWRVLGIAMGTATLVSLVKSGFSIEFAALPAKVYQNYAWLRDTLWEPVAWLFSYWGLSIPGWVKDIVMAYLLIGSAYMRAFRGFFPGEKQRPLTSFGVLILWPLTHQGILRSGEYPPSKVIKANLKELKKEIQEILESESAGPGDRIQAHLAQEAVEVFYLRRRLVWYIVLTIFSASAFFLWNYVSIVYGPGN